MAKSSKSRQVSGHNEGVVALLMRVGPSAARLRLPEIGPDRHTRTAAQLPARTRSAPPHADDETERQGRSSDTLPR